VAQSIDKEPSGYRNAFCIGFLICAQGCQRIRVAYKYAPFAHTFSLRLDDPVFKSISSGLMEHSSEMRGPVAKRSSETAISLSLHDVGMMFVLVLTIDRRRSKASL
jgi:hypothetical protein